MRCERYWREGILLVEQGRTDPHRESCLDCRRAHESRGELVRTFKLVGARGGDPRWQERVWRQVEGRPTREPTRIPWLVWGGGLAAACALALVVSQGMLHRNGGPGARGEQIADARQPGFEIIPADQLMRSPSAAIGDRVRIWVRPTQEARIYRADELVLRCTAEEVATPGCSRDGGGVAAEHTFKLAGDYQLVIAPAGLAPTASGAGVEAAGAGAGAEPARSFDRDMAAIMAAGRTYQLHKLAVR